MALIPSIQHISRLGSVDCVVNNILVGDANEKELTKSDVGLRHGEEEGMASLLLFFD